MPLRALFKLPGRLISKDLHIAAELLRSGQLVGIPTETVYGLAANGCDPKAVAGIFDLKDRPRFDPVILHFADPDRVEPYVKGNMAMAHSLFRAFSPGALTLLLPKTDKVSDIVTAGLPKVALRIPDHSMTLDLLRELPFPLAAPSANLFGRTSPTRPEHVTEQFGKELPLVLDGGACAVGIESTILDISEKKPLILRQGGISQEALEAHLGYAIESKLSSSRPEAPGMIHSHYSPGCPVALMKDDVFPNEGFQDGDRIIRFRSLLDGVPEKAQIILSTQGDVREAASRLFKALHDSGSTEPRVIWAECVPEKGVGRAINDRLRRAARAQT
ncbi:MAG: Threonylcarbamoyl-AMP synthase [Flavobacteriia bacterium]|nr:MAG: Threonylcarbamoyl-AMP synthase [Flavobacteriia bacterium]